MVLRLLNCSKKVRSKSAKHIVINLPDIWRTVSPRPLPAHERKRDVLYVASNASACQWFENALCTEANIYSQCVVWGYLPMFLPVQMVQLEAEQQLSRWIMATYICNCDCTHAPLRDAAVCLTGRQYIDLILGSRGQSKGQVRHRTARDSEDASGYLKWVSSSAAKVSTSIREGRSQESTIIAGTVTVSTQNKSYKQKQGCPK